MLTVSYGFLFLGRCSLTENIIQTAVINVVNKRIFILTHCPFSELTDTSFVIPKKITGLELRIGFIHLKITVYRVVKNDDAYF